MKTFKIEVKLNKEQKALFKLNQSAGRVVYNLYVSKIEEWLRNNEKVLSSYEFSKWFNNVYIPENPDMQWLKKASSKHLKDIMNNCYSAFVAWRKEKDKGLPKKKKASTDKTGFYFVKTDDKSVIKYQRNKIKIPCIGWVTFKEMNYLPDGLTVTSGHLKLRAGRYEVSVLTDGISLKDEQNQNDGLGIDRGLKDFLILSNGVVFENINKSKKIKKLERKLKREQRAISRKYEALKKVSKEERTYKNIQKNKLRIEKTYKRIEDIKNAYINKCVDRIVDMKPSYITIEKLNLKGMMKNKHLSKSVQDSKLYYTEQKLIEKANKHGIEVRQVSQWYPSSKTCFKCSHVKKDLKLSDRTYVCEECGYIEDRDINAALNLKHAKDYEILTEKNSMKPTDGLSGSDDCGVSTSTVVGHFRELKNETGHAEAVKSIKCNSSNIDERCKIFKSLNTFEYKL